VVVVVVVVDLGIGKMPRFSQRSSPIVISLFGMFADTTSLTRSRKFPPWGRYPTIVVIPPNHPLVVRRVPRRTIARRFRMSHVVTTMRSMCSFGVRVVLLLLVLLLLLLLLMFPLFVVIARRNALVRGAGSTAIATTVFESPLLLAVVVVTGTGVHFILHGICSIILVTGGGGGRIIIIRVGFFCGAIAVVAVAASVAASSRIVFSVG